MGNFDKSGTELTAEGQYYTQVVGAGTAVSIKAAPGRVAKVIGVAGTGTPVIYDNAVGNTSGNVLWPGVAMSVGAIIAIGIPTNLGISIVVPVSTTVNIVWT